MQMPHCWLHLEHSLALRDQRRCRQTHDEQLVGVYLGLGVLRSYVAYILNDFEKFDYCMVRHCTRTVVTGRVDVEVEEERIQTY